MADETNPNGTALGLANPLGPPQAPAEPTNRIWQQVVANYYNELENSGIEPSSIGGDLRNTEKPEDLTPLIEALQKATTTPKGGALIRSLNRFQPVLSSLNDLVAVSSCYMGVDTKVAIALWGSVRLIMRLAQPTLPDANSALRTLEQALPRLRKYEAELPMNESLTGALTKLYHEIVVLYSHATITSRSSRKVNRTRVVTSKCAKDLSKVMKNIQMHFGHVEEAAALIGLTRVNDNRAHVRARRRLASRQPARVTYCVMVPVGADAGFAGRDREFRILQDTLNPDRGSALRVLGIHGMAGVGKSQLAFQYINATRDQYRVIAWIPANDSEALVEALSELAHRLGLIHDREHRPWENPAKVQRWLNEAETPFLLIFDNVQSINMLDEIWPTSNKGSIIITSRAPLEASEQVPHTISVECLPMQESKQMIQLRAGFPATGQKEVAALQEICNIVGGLPFGIARFTNIIQAQGCSYQEFVRLYSDSMLDAFQNRPRLINYDPSITRLFTSCLAGISDDGRTLLNLVLLLDPGKISERMLREAGANISAPEYGFLGDDSRYNNAVFSLCQTSLVTRDTARDEISIHPLAQHALVCAGTIPSPERQFEIAVAVLSCSFPNVWKSRGEHEAHGYDDRESCGNILPHVENLINLSLGNDLTPANTAMWVKLILRMATHLWETQRPSKAISYCEMGLTIDPDLPANILSHGHRVLGHAQMDLARPKEAFESYLSALELRQEHGGHNTIKAADGHSFAAAALLEQGNVPAALSTMDIALMIGSGVNPGEMAGIHARHAMILLRAGNLEAALQALRQSWTVQGIAEEDLATSEYHKHSGDLMLLARIYQAMDRVAEARNTALLALTMRQRFYDDEGPRVADTLFFLARMLEKTESGAEEATKLYLKIIAMPGDDMDAHMARAIWFLANLDERGGARSSIVENLRLMATGMRERIENMEWAKEDTDEGYERLVTWMLW